MVGPLLNWVWGSQRKLSLLIYQMQGSIFGPRRNSCYYFKPFEGLCIEPKHARYRHCTMTRPQKRACGEDKKTSFAARDHWKKVSLELALTVPSADEECPISMEPM